MTGQLGVVTGKQQGEPNSYAGNQLGNMSGISSTIQVLSSQRFGYAEYLETQAPLPDAPQIMATRSCGEGRGRPGRRAIALDNISNSVQSRVGCRKDASISALYKWSSGDTPNTTSQPSARASQLAPEKIEVHRSDSNQV